jgi:hypothetical protein
MEISITGLDSASPADTPDTFNMSRLTPFFYGSHATGVRIAGKWARKRALFENKCAWGATNRRGHGHG